MVNKSEKFFLSIEAAGGREHRPAFSMLRGAFSMDRKLKDRKGINIAENI